MNLMVKTIRSKIKAIDGDGAINTYVLKAPRPVRQRMSDAETVSAAAIQSLRLTIGIYWLPVRRADAENPGNKDVLE